MAANVAVILLRIIGFWMLLMIAATPPASAQPSKPCGEIVCGKYEYCGRQQKNCFNCSGICNKSHHNYNEQDCQEWCQDYIHDFVEDYVRKEDLKYLEETLGKLYEIVLISFLLLLCLTAAALFVEGRRLYQWRKKMQEKKLEQKKYQQKLTSVQYMIGNNTENNNSSHQKELVRTISRSMKEAGPSTMTLTTQTTMTDSSQNTNRSSCSGTAKTFPLSTQEPCEDTSLDYAAYVNQALSTSPIRNKNVV